MPPRGVVRRRERHTAARPPGCRHACRAAVERGGGGSGAHHGSGDRSRTPLLAPTTPHLARDGCERGLPSRSHRPSSSSFWSSVRPPLLARDGSRAAAAIRRTHGRRGYGASLQRVHPSMTSKRASCRSARTRATPATGSGAHAAASASASGRSTVTRSGYGTNSGCATSVLPTPASTPGRETVPRRGKGTDSSSVMHHTTSSDS